MSIFTKKNKIQKFTKNIKNKSKKEIRKAEEALLKPEDIPQYDGPQTKHRSELASRTALIVFKNKEQQQLIGNLFNIKTSVNNVTYITDISLLHNIAVAVQNEELELVNNSIEMVAQPDNLLFKKLSKKQIKQLPKRQRKQYKKACKILSELKPELFTKTPKVSRRKLACTKN